MYELMTPGPTQVSASVLAARAQWAPNPDQDEDFLELYHKTAQRITQMMGGDETFETFILAGEGMLALEAAVASLTEPGDRVLILDNGIFGGGFADLVRLYGGIPVVYNMDYRRPLDPIALDIYLRGQRRIKYATLVHCDTPSGMCNDIAAICPVLKRYGLLTLVDAVATMFGQPVHVSQGIDVLCGATQKALSAPAGLCFATLSPEGRAAIAERKSPVPGFYANLQTYLDYYEKRWFPYTMPAHDILGLAAALDVVEADEERYSRHALLARATRAALEKGGLELYPQGGYAETVTAFCVPEGLSDKEVLRKMREEHGIMISGSFDVLEGQVLRIGHMGENCQREKLVGTFEALQQVFTDLGFVPDPPLAENFQRRC